MPIPNKLSGLRLSCSQPGKNLVKARKWCNSGEADDTVPEINFQVVAQMVWSICYSENRVQKKSFRGLYSIPSSFASVFHLLFTRDLVFSSIRISSGQGRVKPSLAHLRVASMPIFEPKFGSRDAWSSESTGPSVN